MPLTDTQVRHLKSKEKAYKVADGGGLYIHVTATGSKLWRMRYRVGGKEQLLSFGAYPEVSLARAREKRQDAKALLADGIDPMAKQKADRNERAAKNEHTFSNIAAELVDKLRKEGKAETTLKKKQWLIDMANKDFGDHPIRNITPPLILVALRKVEALGNHESAKRLRSTIGQVFRYAIATARAALKLMALLYTRPGELRLALWEEFDLEAAIWTIPESRTKMRREHVKPLPAMAVEILRQLQAETGSNYRAFPSLIARDRPISENTMNQALRRMGFAKDEHTSHGFRASASSLLNESGLWNEDAIEAELAHVGSDQVRRAYQRSRFWEERLHMADWWAKEIESMLRST
eukprot:TRINITY_DN34692_c0_g1_i1.p1 TRINITY_DN34692_c0_g1~~TRINITY_DN34692_c0_g1_i1.p1  ORF type:complete len:350 (-),score=32.56 TRINITY_DN34692_c0_g1_i1:1474-2523(-)